MRWPRGWAEEVVCHRSFEMTHVHLGSRAPSSEVWQVESGWENCVLARREEMILGLPENRLSDGGGTI